MVWRRRSAVLAIAIRYRLSPTGKAQVPPAFVGLPPRLSSLAGSATPQTFPKSQGLTMSKRHDEIDLVPFVPSSSPVCRVADLVLVYCVALLGLAAAVFAVCRQVIG